MRLSHNRSLRAALIAGTLALIGVIGFACASSSEPAVTATATATAVPEPTTEADLSAFLDQVDDRVVAIRGIEKPPPVPYHFLSQDELRDFLDSEFEDEEGLDDIKTAQAEFKLLGLIPQDMDLLNAYLALLNAQVLGAYDSEKEEFVVLQPSGQFGPSEEFTYAHEYTHRLQDSKFDLDKINDMVKDNDDRSTAVTALIEGDASAVQQLYAQDYFNFTQLQQILQEASAAQQSTPDLPYVLTRSLEFPYVEGLSFVNKLLVSNSFTAVDDAFGDLPDSTEQILHPSKFLDREAPATVDLPDSLFGDGWTISDENVFGEFFLKTWLESLGVKSTDSAPAAAGWGGDRYAFAEDADGNTALAAVVVWDNPSQDAAEFYSAMSGALDTSQDFQRINTGVNVGISAFQGPGGVLVIGNLTTPDRGALTAIAAAKDLDTAMPLLLATVS